MQVAKIDGNNIVLDTFLVRVEKVLDKSTGTVTIAKTQAWCETRMGAGTYIPESVAKNEPEIGNVWMATEKVFADERPNDLTGAPCTSWTCQTTVDTDEITAIGDWAPPHHHGAHSEALRKFRWKESNQTWYAQQISDEVWYSWDNIAQNWVTTGSTDNPS